MCKLPCSEDTLRHGEHRRTLLLMQEGFFGMSHIPPKEATNWCGRSRLDRRFADVCMNSIRIRRRANGHV